ncbi:hypothetical protein SHIRM173S_09611 [Streptomyces hirsutus]
MVERQLSRSVRTPPATMPTVKPLAALGPVDVVE